MTDKPVAARPEMGAAYDQWAPDGGKGKTLPWSWVQEQMYRARSYWIATASKNGPPATTPVWGLFIDDVFYFNTTGTSKKARSIQRTGEATVHLESADSVVVVEGKATRENDPELIEKLAKAFYHKYQIEVVGKFPDQVMISIRPQRVFAWMGFPESEFMRTMSRFELD